MLSAQSGIFMTLNTSLPDDNELDTAVDNGYFQLIRRGGYVQSFNYADIFYKKKNSMCLVQALALKKNIKELLLMYLKRWTSVYRLLKPMFLGVIYDKPFTVFSIKIKIARSGFIGSGTEINKKNTYIFLRLERFASLILRN